MNYLEKVIVNQLKIMIPEKRFGSIFSGGVDSSLQSALLSKISQPHLLMALNHIGKDNITKNILHSYNNGIRCILIITGKKLGLQGSEGVLKREVPKWLNMSPLREVVLMNSWATSQHGGQGALYVLLKKFK